MLPSKRTDGIFHLYHTMKGRPMFDVRYSIFDILYHDFGLVWGALLHFTLLTQHIFLSLLPLLLLSSLAPSPLFRSQLSHQDLPLWPQNRIPEQMTLPPTGLFFSPLPALLFALSLPFPSLFSFYTLAPRSTHIPFQLQRSRSRFSLLDPNFHFESTCLESTDRCRVGEWRWRRRSSLGGAGEGFGFGWI